MFNKCIVVLICSVLLIGCTNISQQEEYQKLLSEIENTKNELLESEADYGKLLPELEDTKKELLKLEIEYDTILPELEETKVQLIETQDQYEILLAEYNIMKKNENSNSWEDRVLFSGGYEELLLAENYMLDNSNIELVNAKSNIYDPNDVLIGDSIFGFTVLDTVFENGGYEKIEFDGYFILTGELNINLADGTMLTILCSNDEIANSLPVSITWLDSYKNHMKQFYWFDIYNEEILREQLTQERLDLMKGYSSIEYGITYKITAVFNNFTYAYKPATGIHSSFDFIELLYIEEVVN